MRFPFRAIGAGILAGTAFFFVPFLFRFFLFALLIGFVIRLIGGGYRRHWGRRYFGTPAFNNGYDEDNDIIPIDGSRYVPHIKATGPERRFNVS